MDDKDFDKWYQENSLHPLRDSLDEAFGVKKSVEDENIDEEFKVDKQTDEEIDDDNDEGFHIEEKEEEYPLDDEEPDEEPYFYDDNKGLNFDNEDEDYYHKEDYYEDNSYDLHTEDLGSYDKPEDMLEELQNLDPFSVVPQAQDVGLMSFV
eukprot:Gb_14973 [translate_table: standard]